jgi:hypothetical protein
MAAPSPSAATPVAAQELEATVALLLTTFEAHRRDVHEDEGLGTLSAGSQPDTQGDDCSSFLTVFAGVLLQMGQLLQQPSLRPGSAERAPMAQRLCNFLSIVVQQKVCPHSHMVFGEGAPDKVGCAQAAQSPLRWPPRPPPPKPRCHAPVC